MQNKILLSVGVVLLIFGVFKPDLSNIGFPININEPACSVESYVTDAPEDTELLEKARAVTDIVKSSNDSTRKSDCLKLSSLYADIATLIELDGSDMVVKDTASIRQVNGIAGNMLRLDVKNKYPGLAESAKDLLVSSIGDDDVVLDEETRANAVKSFMALSWAFYEGSK
jgi:hypothetical protein